MSSLVPHPFVAGLGLVLAGCTAAGPEDSWPEPPRPAPALSPGSPRTELEAPAVEADEPAAAGDEAGSRALPEEEPSPENVLGRVAGSPLTAEDLVLGWYEVAGREVWLVVEKIVATRLAFAEAQRLGIRLRPDSVDERVAEERVELEERAAEAGFSVEDFVTSQLGVAPAIYFERLRRATIRQMIAERAVRAWILKNENLELSLIVVAEEEQMAGIRAELEAGADFAELAVRHSVDDTAPDGGLVSFLVRQEHSPLARLAFATPVGELGGPLHTSGHEFLIRVEERRAALEGDWRSIASEVEETLATHPVTDSEFLYWKLAMEDRYPIDLRRLKELLGLER